MLEASPSVQQQCPTLDHLQGPSVFSNLKVLNTPWPRASL